MGGKFDKSFNEATYTGAERFKKETGIAYREFEVTNEAQREQALRNMARRGAPIVTVMRQGQVVATLPTAETTPEQLAELMVGRRVSLRVEKAPCHPDEPVLEVVDLVVEGGLEVARVKGVAFTVRRGSRPCCGACTHRGKIVTFTGGEDAP